MVDEIQIAESLRSHLRRIAKCHIKAFPNSLSSRLGLAYCEKMLEWYLISPNRFLFHISNKNEVIGYCGGFVRAGELHGSSTGMTQHAFKTGLKSFVFRPWLLLHPKLRRNYKFILRNIFLRFFADSKPTVPQTQNLSEINDHMKTAGLVVIGVDPAFRGRGLGRKLILEFESRSIEMGCQKLVLSVETDNKAARSAYLNNGWLNGDKKGDTITMYKFPVR